MTKKTFDPRFLSAFLIVLSASLTLWTSMALADDDDDGKREHKSRASASTAPAAEDPLYKAECSSCHMLYPPWLLPSRSWKAVLAGLKNHFGENAEMTQPEVDKLSKFLEANASDRGPAHSYQNITRRIPANTTPLSLSETEAFKREHHEVGAKVWLRKSIVTASNCVACHSKAEAGNFDEDGVHIPK